MDYLTRIRTFDLTTLPDLDEVVLGALHYLSDFDIPQIDRETYRRPLVIGSVNAFRIGKILFQDTDARFANESSYRDALAEIEHIDAVYIISASGGKHAREIAREVSALSLPLFLITNNFEAPAAEYVIDENVLLFPHIREPYTYNTSTYLSMLLSTGEERAEDILAFVESSVLPQIPETLGTLDAFTLMLPTQFDTHKGLFQTKFDELFGPRVVGRAFTIEQMKHAKTVIPSDTEGFISFGVSNTDYGKEHNRITIPLPKRCGPAAMMAIGYVVIGAIQRQHHAFFKEHIEAYCAFASQVFGQTINPIVE